MRYGIALFCLVALVGGCATTNHGTALGPGLAYSTRANLALGPSADHSWLATRIGERTDWPAVETGRRVEEVTFYTTVIYDEQSAYDRSGAVVHETQSVQSGMRLR